MDAETRTKIHTKKEKQRYAETWIDDWNIIWKNEEKKKGNATLIPRKRKKITQVTKNLNTYT